MAKHKSGRFGPLLIGGRIWVQALFVVVWANPFMLRLHNVCAPVFHCYSCPLATFACPIGVLANFSALHVFPFLAVGTLLVVGALLGSIVCGWLCPFGFLQDLIGKVPTPKLRLPAVAGYSRYFVLGAFVVAIPFFFGERSALFFCRLCPAGALEGAVPFVARQALAGGPIAWPGAVKIVILILFLTGAFFVWRPWCRLFCPLGAIYGILNRFSLVLLRFHPGRCDDCGRCERPCRYGVTPDRGAGDPTCIRCLECTGCGAIGIGTVFGSSRPEDSESAAARGKRER